MSWANPHIQRLVQGETVQFRPRGNSMVPRINSGDLCTVEPVTDRTVLAKNDIVLCKVRGTQYLHLISAQRGDQYQISNNQGRVNGWTSIRQIYGRLIHREP